MPVEFNTTPKKLFQSVVFETDRALTKGLDVSSQFMARQLDLSYENRGFLQENPRGKGFQPYEPTTRIAKMNRINYPKSAGKTGKKGFTQEQAQYIYASNSLEDTGKMRASIAIEKDDTKNIKTRHIGAGVDYIKLHEEGGTYNGHDVPARPSQYITEGEMSIIDDLVLESLR